MRTLLRLGIGSIAVVALLALAGLAGSEEAAAKTGKDIFLAGRCNACHAIESQGIKADEAAAEPAGGEEGEAGDDAEPPDLSSYGNQGKDAAWTAKFITKKEMKDGKKHMKRFKGTPEELQALADWLVTLKTEKK